MKYFNSMEYVELVSVMQTTSLVVGNHPSHDISIDELCWFHSIIHESNFNQLRIKIVSCTNVSTAGNLWATINSHWTTDIVQQRVLVYISQNLNCNLTNEPLYSDVNFDQIKLPLNAIQMYFILKIKSIKHSLIHIKI